ARDAPARANDEYAPAETEGREIVVEIDVGEMLENHVRSLAVRQILQLVEIAALAVIQHVARPLRQDERAAFRRSGGSNDGQTERARNLRRREPDAAARAVNEEGVARPDPRAPGEGGARR